MGSLNLSKSTKLNWNYVLLSNYLQLPPLLSPDFNRCFFAGFDLRSQVSKKGASYVESFTVLQKNVLEHKYPCESHQEHCSPHYFLLKLSFPLFYCKKLLVRITLLLFLIEFVLFVHASHFFFVPDSLIVIYLKLWTSRHKPPKIINPKQSLSTIIEILLFAVLLLFLVYKTLVVIDGVDSLLQQLEAEVGEQTPLHKRNDRTYERIGIPWIPHNLPCVVGIK